MTKKKARIAERGSLIETAAIDWITMTTQNGAQWDIARAWIEDHAKGKAPEVAKSHGYELDVYPFGSVGDGMQGGEPSYIVTVSGIDSDGYCEHLATHPLFNPAQWNCSRVDLQITVPSTRRFRLSAIATMYQDQQLGEFNSRGKPKVWAIAGDDGDTLYIGAFSSDKMMRFYDKPLLVNRKREVYERFEVQLRNERSLAMFRHLFKNRAVYQRRVILQALKYHFGTLPDLMQAELSPGKQLAAVIGLDAPAVVSDKDEDAKVRWALRLKATFQGTSTTTRRGRRKGARDAIGVPSIWRFIRSPRKLVRLAVTRARRVRDFTLDN